MGQYQRSRSGKSFAVVITDDSDVCIQEQGLGRDKSYVFASRELTVVDAKFHYDIIYMCFSEVSP